ncbi:hypothetical protein [Pantoea septica]|uniref:hypothetical protein n=1 Tax=Pantoea septica TaxID=472695 RepID=UPI003D071A36
MGRSSARVIETMRLAFARNKIEDTNHSLSVIAGKSGFPDVAIMRKAFRCTMDLSLKDGRREGANEGSYPGS